jgi:hypothetical protein
MKRFRHAPKAVLLAAILLLSMAGVAYAQGANVGLRSLGIPAADKVIEAVGANEAADVGIGVQSSEYTVYTFNNNLQGSIVVNLLGGVPETNSTTGEVTTSKGVVGFLSNSVSQMYDTPPANTETYVASVMRDLNIAPPAYAQGVGVGFAALNPVLEAWTAFRNLAYLFFVVIFIVIGFMIMLRRRVGQAAITAQQAIPQITIALLAVTFSYAISGLLIDAMYIVMYLIIGLFGKSENDFLSGNIFTLGWKMVTGGVDTAYDTVSNMVEGMINIPLLDQLDALEFIGGITAALVIAIAIAIAVFGIFFELLKTYVTIIILVIMSPLWLMMGAIPGRSTFTKWIRSMIGNLAAFPALLIVLLIYDTLTGGFSNDRTFETGGFSPPYLLGVQLAGAIPFLVGLGLLMGAKEAIVQAKKAMGADDGGVFGAIIGAGWKRAGKAADVAIPGVAGTTAAGAGAYTAYRTMGGEPDKYTTVRQRASGLFRGVQTIGPDGQPIQKGGVVPRFRAGAAFGQKVRGTIDDVADQRFLEPDNWRKYLSRMAPPEGKTPKGSH